MSMSKNDIARYCIDEKISALGLSDDEYLEIMRLVDVLYDACELM